MWHGGAVCSTLHRVYTLRLVGSLDPSTEQTWAAPCDCCPQLPTAPLLLICCQTQLLPEAQGPRATLVAAAAAVRPQCVACSPCSGRKQVFQQQAVCWQFLKRTVKSVQEGKRSTLCLPVQHL